MDEKSLFPGIAADSTLEMEILHSQKKPRLLAEKGIKESVFYLLLVLQIPYFFTAGFKLS